MSAKESWTKRQAQREEAIPGTALAPAGPMNAVHRCDRCGAELDVVYGATLDELAELGLLARDEVGVRLTDRGRMLGNRVFEQIERNVPVILAQRQWHTTGYGYHSWQRV